MQKTPIWNLTSYIALFLITFFPRSLLCNEKAVEKRTSTWKISIYRKRDKKYYNQVKPDSDYKKRGDRNYKRENSCAPSADYRSLLALNDMYFLRRPRSNDIVCILVTKDGRKVEINTVQNIGLLTVDFGAIPSVKQWTRDGVKSGFGNPVDENSKFSSYRFLSSYGKELTDMEIFIDLKFDEKYLQAFRMRIDPQKFKKYRKNGLKIECISSDWPQVE